MAKQCYCCGLNTIFYVWTSSRNFPREKLVEVMNIDGITKKSILIDNEGKPICYGCYNELMNHE